MEVQVCIWENLNKSCHFLQFSQIISKPPMGFVEDSMKYTFQMLSAVCGHMLGFHLAEAAVTEGHGLDSRSSDFLSYGD